MPLPKCNPACTANQCFDGGKSCKSSAPVYHRVNDTGRQRHRCRKQQEHARLAAAVDAHLNTCTRKIYQQQQPATLCLYPPSASPAADTAAARLAHDNIVALATFPSHGKSKDDESYKCSMLAHTKNTCHSKCLYHRFTYTDH